MNSIADREDDGPPTRVDAQPSDYKPPANPYAFPPNIDAPYPPPGNQKPISHSSYLPPPSGLTNYPIYPGPVPVSSLNTQVDNSDSLDNTNDMGDMDGGKDDSSMDNGNPDGPSDDMKLIDKPPANFMPNKKPQFPAVPFLDSHDHDDHGHDHSQHEHEHEEILDHPPHDYHSYDGGPFSPYDDSLKHLHGFEAFPGNNNLNCVLLVGNIISQKHSLYT